MVNGRGWLIPASQVEVAFDVRAEAVGGTSGVEVVEHTGAAHGTIGAHVVGVHRASTLAGVGLAYVQRAIVWRELQTIRPVDVSAVEDPDQRNIGVDSIHRIPEAVREVDPPPRTFIPIVAGIVVALAALTPAAAQPRGAGGGGPRYDLASEATVNGTVESVEQIAGPGSRGRRGLGGTHLVLRTGTGTVMVHLGPTAFLAEQQLVVRSGDTLEITGSRVTVDDDAVFIARSVRRGASAWTLRDAAGLSLWRGGKRP